MITFDFMVCLAPITLYIHSWRLSSIPIRTFNHTTSTPPHSRIIRLSFVASNYYYNSSAGVCRRHGVGFIFFGMIILNITHIPRIRAYRDTVQNGLFRYELPYIGEIADQWVGEE